MALRIFQKGFNFSQDGPGNRLVYHLQGCNLRCPWCANPEGLASSGGQEYDLAALTDEVLRSRPMFFDGGGVTLTGGEISMQHGEVKAFLTTLKAHGIHTCIETNGTSPKLRELFPVVDLLIMDIKHYDPEIHQSITGGSNAQTHCNIREGIRANVPLALRIPLIGGFNASADDARGFAKLLTELGAPEKATVELLTYHEYGKDKYARLGMPYTMTDSAWVSREQVREFTSILENAGLTVVRT